MAPGFTPPTAVGMRAWNGARPAIAARYGWPPLAHEVRRQVNALDGHRTSWGELLREALANGAHS
jgi:hypothetical protein